MTYIADDWPVFWEEAVGSNVRDADGNVYVDLTSAFGVALLGHAPPPVLRAMSEQSRLIHGMGDIHPPVKKLELLEALAEISPWEETKTILAGSGSEAVEAALKTARLASGRPGVLAFDGGYHGLTLGPLAATKRQHFRRGFEERLYEGVVFAPFPDPLRDDDPQCRRALETISRMLDEGAPNGDAIGTVIIEPLQARGGCRVPPEGFLDQLGRRVREAGALVVADEIFTGLGRCGVMFVSEELGLEPDIVCVGKALGGGIPISACLGPTTIMDAWPPSDGEAIHTSTFLGHPLACAAAVEVLEELRAGTVLFDAQRLGSRLHRGLVEAVGSHPSVGEVRGMGLLVGIDLVEADGRTPAPLAGVRVARRALAEGLLVLPAGDVGNVVELTPPVTLADEQVSFVVEVLGRIIRELMP
ncbi:MAG: aspartate aminotransferase family protein [Gemmatimonadetes bacterium]|nr:aspartate aminotransferase family protein [Gemmatimonadota bacterium]